MKFSTSLLLLNSVSSMKIVGEYTEGYLCDDLLPLYTVPSIGDYDILSSKELYQSNQVWGFIQDECNDAYDDIDDGYNCVFVYINRDASSDESAGGCAAYKTEGMTDIKQWYLDYGYTEDEYEENFALSNYRFASALGTKNGL